LDWKQLADRLDYERLLPRILDDSRLIEREIALAPSERALTNFLHLFEILLDEVLASRCELEELVRRLTRWIHDTERSEERNLQRLESERDAVQIMTVHRSKGLEAEVVFLVGGDGQAPARPVRAYHDGGERRVHVGKLPGGAIDELIALEERGESERLLYVALTRAARRLYVPCWPAPAAGDGRRLAELLNARVQGWLSAGGEEGLVAVERIAPEDGAAPATGAGDLAATWQPPDALRAGAEAGAAPLGLAGDRLGPVTTSYTRLKQAERASRAPEVATFDAGDPGDLDPTDPEPDTAGDGPAPA